MKRALAAALTATLLGACGGGGGDDSPPADPTAAVPPEAGQSVGGLIEYLQRLIAADAQGKEPIDLQDFQPPQADDGEPIDLS